MILFTERTENQNLSKINLSPFLLKLGRNCATFVVFRPSRAQGIARNLTLEKPKCLNTRNGLVKGLLLLVHKDRYFNNIYRGKKKPCLATR